MFFRPRCVAPLLVAAAVCLPVDEAPGGVLTGLATQRHWIGYTPRGFNPNIGLNPSQAQIRADLEQLYNDGWRKLYTYTLDGSLQHVPRIAKEVGFDTALAGVFYFDDAQLAREKANAQAQVEHIDGFIVGNEGLIFGRYTGEQLLDALTFFAEFGKPITTTEVGGVYLQFPELIDVGDFAYVNIQPWFNGSLDPTDPAALAQAVRDEYVAIKALRPDRLVVIKEAWWPTGGNPAATEANQTAFYQALANQTDANGDPILFSWGESYDQGWKSEPSPFGTLGPDWGLYEADGAPKAIVSDLSDTFTAPVPVNFLPGDYNRDGAVNAADHAVWAAAFGDTIGVPGAGADGNFDGRIDAADYTVWRDNLGAAADGAAAGVPEPATLVLAAALWLVGLRGRRRRIQKTV